MRFFFPVSILNSYFSSRFDYNNLRVIVFCLSRVLTLFVSLVRFDDFGFVSSDLSFYLNIR